MSDFAKGCLFQTRPDTVDTRFVLLDFLFEELSVLNYWHSALHFRTPLPYSTSVLHFRTSLPYFTSVLSRTLTLCPVRFSFRRIKCFELLTSCSSLPYFHETTLLVGKKVLVFWSQLWTWSRKARRQWWALQCRNRGSWCQCGHLATTKMKIKNDEQATTFWGRI